MTYLIAGLSPDTTTIIAYGIIGLFILIFIVGTISLLCKASKAGSDRRNLNNYIYLRIGMTEDEMVKIMGTVYSLSQFKGGVKKFEWRTNSSFSLIQGSMIRNYGVSKIEVITKDGLIEQIIPYNV